jgi:hypothetical protein
MDRVDPLSNPLEHLLVDAPEHLAGTTSAFIVVRRLGTTVYDMYKNEGKSTKDAAIAAVLAGYVAGTAIDNLVFKTVTSSLEKKRSE